MEKDIKKDKKDDRKESEGLHDEEVDKAFEKWTGLGHKWNDSPVCGNDNKEHFPSVSLKLPGKCIFKVEEEVEVKFKACVESISKDKDGTRVSLELKEVKF